MSKQAFIIAVAMSWGGVCLLTYHEVGMFKGQSLEMLALIGVAWCFVFLIKLSAKVEDMKHGG